MLWANAHGILDRRGGKPEISFIIGMAEEAIAARQGTGAHTRTATAHAGLVMP